MDDLRKSIVGILSKSSSHKYAGTGFFVTGGLILTCAHVVDSARKQNDKIVFCIEGSEKRYNASLVFKSEAIDLDIAILQPLDLTEAAPTLRLVPSRQSDGHAFNSFGYPLEGSGQGLYGDGKIHNWVRDSHGHDALQISSNKITHGFSGCPVWDNELNGVVGMVNSGFDFGLNKKLGDVAFAIPSEVLKIAYPGLQPSADWHFAHRYGDRPNFTGRVAERKLLSEWLNDNTNTLFILRALGGFGKSALSWYWLNNDVDKTKWKKVVWWSFYEGDASFDNFLGDTLEYLGLPNAHKINPRQQVRVLLEQLQSSDILLVLDGFERLLRVFQGMGAVYQGDQVIEDSQQTIEEEARGRDCISLATDDFLRGLNDPKLRGKVLMTTRLCPHVLETHDGELQPGCIEKELTALTPADAYIFFTEKEKIKATRAEVEAACAPYAYHPLSLNLLAGLIKKDFEHPYDIRAAQKYYLNSEIKNHKEHILKVAYETLSAERQKLLSNIACLRGSVDYATIKTIFAPVHLDETLSDLQERGLLLVSTTESTNSRSTTFDLHPIVRRYTYDRLTATDKTATHERLVDYFAALPEREKIEKLDDLAPVIELYHHMVRAEKFDQAADLYYHRLLKKIYYQMGAYQLAIELIGALFPNGQDKLPKLNRDDAQGWALNELANAYSLSGQPQRAILLLENSFKLAEKMGAKKNLAISLGNLACVAQIYIGALAQAEHNLRRRIELSREIENEESAGTGLYELGRVLAYCGNWTKSDEKFNDAEQIKKRTNHIQAQSIIWSYRALRCLLIAREAANSNQSLVVSDQQSASECAKRALELADEWQKQVGRPNAHDYIRCHWLLGAAYRVSGHLPQAETHLGEALHRCRTINMVDMETNILLELTKLRHAQGETREALRLVREALIITERSEYVLQGADVHLFLAELALQGQKLESDKAMADKECALTHAQKARRLATGWEMIDGKQVYDESGEYVYKVAYDEAGRLIEKLTPPLPSANSQA